jgi:uncharacterized membrane protein
MNQKNHSSDEEIIKRMIKSTKHQAPENLKYRIMHQIETEHALAPKRVKARKETTNVLRDFGIIFGLMYTVLAVIIGGAYVVGGKELLFSVPFLETVLLVSFVFSLFWLITQLDAYLRKCANK